MEMKYVGYCDKMPFKKGDRVRILKGCPLSTTHPKHNDTKGRYTASRSQVITVHHTLPGMTEYYGTERETHLSNPSVCWPGSGGYWIDADINYVELVDDTTRD